MSYATSDVEDKLMLSHNQGLENILEYVTGVVDVVREEHIHLERFSTSLTNVPKIDTSFI